MVRARDGGEVFLLRPELAVVDEVEEVPRVLERLHVGGVVIDRHRGVGRDGVQLATVGNKWDEAGGFVPGVGVIDQVSLAGVVRWTAPVCRPSAGDRQLLGESVGGVLYTVGAVCDPSLARPSPRPIRPHEVLHRFAMGGALPTLSSSSASCCRSSGERLAPGSWVSLTTARFPVRRSFQRSAPRARPLGRCRRTGPRLPSRRTSSPAGQAGRGRRLSSNRYWRCACEMVSRRSGRGSFGLPRLAPVELVRQHAFNRQHQ